MLKALADLMSRLSATSRRMTPRGRSYLLNIAHSPDPEEVEEVVEDALGPKPVETTTKKK
jgi:hypothetical protein